MKDHINVVMMVPPKYAVIDVIKKIKRVTSLNLYKKALLVKKGLLERGSYMSSRILWLNNWNIRKRNDNIYKVAAESGFRSSEA